MDRLTATWPRDGARTVGAILLGVLFLAASVAASEPPFDSDPLEVHQWGLDQLRVTGAWDRSLGEGVVIAVIDSGVDLLHPDLFEPDEAGGGENIKFAPGNTFLGCGAVGCGDGHWQMSGGDTGHPHGTHVAGIAAATAGNGTGIAGVAPRATIMPVRALDSNGFGSLQDASHGVRWATDQGADVINLSLGAPFVYEGLSALRLDEGLADALAYAEEAGVVVVAAAGNSTHPYCGSPGSRKGVLCVAATDQTESRTSYSNFPIKLDMLTVSAPGGAPGSCGSSIISTMPRGTGDSECGYAPESEYGEMYGTSMAAPHVAGVAALLVSLGCERQQVLDILTQTARTPGSSDRGEWGPQYGYGIADADAATLSAASVCA